VKATGLPRGRASHRASQRASQRASHGASERASDGARFTRRARPLLGTLVEIGAAESALAGVAVVEAAIGAAFARIAAVQAALSRFEPGSDIGRFNSAPAGTRVAIGSDARHVLAAAQMLGEASAGAFDISLGSGGRAWHCEGAMLHKRSAAVRLDLGGIAKGHAVDVAIEVLADAGVAGGWVNAGGDLRAFGAATLPIDLRDEIGGGVRRFAQLADGAFATSRIADAGGRLRHASVAAPLCLWADALTKIVALSADDRHPLLARFDAVAWLHTPWHARGRTPGHAAGQREIACA
jgi:FAD:protein FMN transferase